MANSIDKTPSNYAAMDVVPFKEGVLIEHHKVKVFRNPYHFHPCIEINYLHDCMLRYSFSGREFQLPKKRLVMFWAAHPHSVMEVRGDGKITIGNIMLSELLKWSLPREFINLLISGAVISSRSKSVYDDELFKRWSREAKNKESHWSGLHAKEIESRLGRLTIEGWDVLLEPASVGTGSTMGGSAVFQFERMLRYITDHFAESITVEDVAIAGNLSRNYAITFFKNLMGKSIMQHIIDMRLSHAKMLLAETDYKIATVATESGFKSQSAFYDAFKKNEGNSPASFRHNSSRVHKFI